MEEIDIKDFLLYLKDKVLYILITILIMIIGVLVYDVFIKVPKYSTYSTIALVKANSEVGYTQSDLNINKSLVTTYSVIVKGKTVLNETINDLKLDYSMNKLAKEINVTSPDDSQLIRISVTDASPKKAYIIAKTVAEKFTNEVAKTYEMNNIRIIEQPEITDTVSNNALNRDLVLGLAAGLFISCGILFVIYYFDWGK